jgi:hypothetical protein
MIYQLSNPTGTTQVSTEDLQNLRQRLKDSNFQWTSLTDAERWRYHAYDYAFLRFRHEPQDAGYALDPHGKWFNEALVQAAERIYTPRRPLPSEPIPRADVEPDTDLAAHFRRQDYERRPLKRQVQVHGERRSDGSYTPEMQAFMECCVRQAVANGEIYKRRSRKTFQREPDMTPKQLLDALGVTAEERKAAAGWSAQAIFEAYGRTAPERKVPKHEDPEELRKAAIELGILQQAD